MPVTYPAKISRCVLLAWALLMSAVCVSSARAETPVGINMAPLSYYNTEWVFVDAMKASSGWVPQLVSGGPWNTGANLNLTADGYPLLASGQAAACVMFVDIQGRYPGGNYVCLYDGQGTIEFGNDAHVVSQTSGRMVVNVTPSNSGILLRVTATNNSNPLRNIRLIMPGFESTYATQPFHPTYIDRMKNFKVLRFMDWQHTNTTNQVNWSDRTPGNYRTQAGGNGVSVEYMVKVCNTLGADPWFCMPHTATDDYVRQFARLVRNSLNPALHVYIEYSNETWNGGFVQAGYCQQMGLQQGLASDQYLAGARYHSKRSVEIFNIWHQEFAGQTNRVVRVLAAQHDNPWIGRQIMDYQNAYQHADAVAVAPYFGYSLGVPSNANNTAGMSIDQILNAAQNEMTGTRRNLTLENAADAAARGLRLLAYEGGQHLVGIGQAMSNQTLNNKFWEANRHSRMYDLYLQDLGIWEAAGGDVFVEYSSAGRYTEWGSWGTYEWQNQPISTAPKFAAIQDFISSGGSTPPKLRQYTGTKTEGRLGFTVASAGDINHDGVKDILVAAPDASVGAPQGGHVYIYSGATGDQLFYKVGHGTNEHFGYAAAGVGDVNGDGFEDVVIGAWGNGQNGANAGKVYVYSGASQTILYTLGGQNAGDRFGFSVAGLGDVNGDNRGDFAVGAWGHDAAGTDSGRVYIVSGANGTTLRVIDGLASGERFGYAVAGVGDVTGDNVGDVLVGAPMGRNGASVQTGKAYVYHANSGALFRAHFGESNGAFFGRSVAWIGDANGDGRNDYGIGAFRSNEGGYQSGKAYIYSGVGGLLFSKVGGSTRDRFGLAISGIGDINFDGKADFAIGSHKAGGSGRVYVFAGGSFNQLATYRGDYFGDKFGHNIAALGDINGDSRPDFMVGAWGNNSGAQHGGRGYVISGLITSPSTAYTMGTYSNDAWWLTVNEPMSLQQLGLASAGSNVSSPFTGAGSGASNVGSATPNGGSATDGVNPVAMASVEGASELENATGVPTYVLAPAGELDSLAMGLLTTQAADLGMNAVTDAMNDSTKTLRNAAFVSPVELGGELFIQGGFEQTRRGVLAMHIATEDASEHVMIHGDATLGGTLIITLDEAVAFELGDEFELITAASIAGSFNTIVTPMTADGLAIEVIVEADRVVGRVVDADDLAGAQELSDWLTAQTLISEVAGVPVSAPATTPTWLVRAMNSWILANH